MGSKPRGQTVDKSGMARRGAEGTCALLQRAVGFGGEDAVGQELRSIDLRDVFHANGKPVFIGAFAVEKKGEVPPGVSKVTRLIMNCVTNAYLRSLAVDLKTLLGACGWCSIVVWNGCYLIWSSDDMKGAYYVLVLPDEWGQFLTFGKTVRWKDLGVDRPGETYVCSRVHAMGSSSAVALFQHVHRRTGIDRGLSPSMELRRDKKLPMKFQDKEAQWTQFFLDDADSPQLVPSSRVSETVGTPSPLRSSGAEQLRQAWPTPKKRLWRARQWLNEWELALMVSLAGFQFPRRR